MAHVAIAPTLTRPKGILVPGLAFAVAWVAFAVVLVASGQGLPGVQAVIGAVYVVFAGMLLVDVDGYPSSPDEGDYYELLESVECGRTGVTGGFAFDGTYRSTNTIVYVSIVGPGVIGFGCTATYLRGDDDRRCASAPPPDCR